MTKSCHIVAAMVLWGAVHLDEAGAQNNSWTNTNFGKWEVPANWSAGAPTNVQTAAFITNAPSKTVTIDATTSGSFPGTLTISNLTISAPPASANTLFLNNAGLVTPLRILDSFTISSRATMLVSSSMVQVAGVSESGSLIIDGFVSLFGGSVLIATNLTSALGITNPSQLVMTNATFLARNFGVAYGNGSVGTFTIQGGIAHMNADWWVATDVNSTGQVWLTGGQLMADSFTDIGLSGAGSMTVSNGTLLASAIFVGENAGAHGTLTMAGGMIQSGLGGYGYNALTVGDNPGSPGAVWITGGQLIATNFSPFPGGASMVIGKVGSGRLVLSNGTVNAGTVTVAMNAGSVGTLTVAGGTFTVNRLVATNSTGTIEFPAGIMTLGGAEINNSQQFRMGGAGQTAVLNLIAGTNHFADSFQIASEANSTGNVWVTGGQLAVTNNTTNVGLAGVGQMTLSNSTWLANEVGIANLSGALGTLTLIGCSSLLTLDLGVGIQPGATGAVSVAGGQLTITNYFTHVGDIGVGQMTISNGTWRASDVVVGYASGSRGTLTLVGSTNLFSGLLSIGGQSGGTGQTGAVWLTGGQLTTTNNTTYVGNYGVGQMTVSNGTWRARDVVAGATAGSIGTLTLEGGVSSVYSNLTIGLTACAPNGVVRITGGELHVTNNPATAVLEVRSGTLIQSGGILDVDRLIVTNPCAHFVHTGGTLIYGILTLSTNLFADADGDGIDNKYEMDNGFDPLDPRDALLDNDGDGQNNLAEFTMGTDPNDPSSYLHISSIVITNQNVLITWPIAPTSGNGLYLDYIVEWGTNMTIGVTNYLGIVGIGPGAPASTNYLDVGGATNRPARFYRIRGITD